MSCPGCDTSSTTYTRCNPPVSTNCVFYQGQTLNCPSDSTFTVCKGENMSDVQKTIFDKICTLSGDIDVTQINLPLCVEEGWKTNDPTILGLLTYMLNVQCEQSELLNTLDQHVNARVEVNGIKTIDPYVKVCLACCGDSSCSGTTTVLLSKALESIITCLCKARTEANNALIEAQNAMTKANLVYNAVFDTNTGLAATYDKLNRLASNITCRVNNIENKLTAAGLTACTPACIVPCPVYP